VPEGGDGGVFLENRMYDPPQGAGSLTVDNPQLQDPPLSALLDVIGHQCLHVAGREGVQVKGAVNRQFVTVVHPG